MKNWFTILFIIGAMFSCSQKEKKGEGKVITVEVDKTSKIMLSDIFDRVDYVPLETVDSSLIGIVERFRLFNDKLCVLSNKSLMLFDKQTGRADLCISKLGNAPREYQSLYDAFVDRKTGEIEVLDMSGRKIQKYDMHGVYRKTQELPSMPFSFIKCGKNDYWFYNNNMISGTVKSELIHFDADHGQIVNEYFPIDVDLAKYFFVVEGNNFVDRGKDILFFCCPSNKIYLLKNELPPTVAYSVDFGRCKVPDEFYKRKFSDIVEFSTEANKRGYVYFINNFSGNQSYVQLSFFLDQKAFWSIYSVHDGTVHTGCILQDDLNSLNSFHLSSLNTLFAMDGGCLYFLISAEQFVEMCSGNDKFSKMLRDNNINDQSNPLLVKCRFRK
ncbi:MAG: 6-bladed beta-propeller [Bacteroides sp.]|jgi:hypothetical protein|nr:6-bladed beta-propeller [Bacteroides sp.]MCI1682552.1 6-bladed beta-propeller [Bacteroides sp.]